jgi:TRAP-type uncharacterized transport system substrate-binding protein
VRIGRVFVSCALIAFAAVGLAQAEEAKLEQRVVTLLAGEPQWFGEALRVTKNLNHQQGLKVLPIQGEGCIESAADLAQISQIDVALLTTDCVKYAELQGLVPDAADKIAYVSRVASLPILVVTRRDITNLTSLAGLRIATGPAHSASFATGELVFGGLGLPFARVPRSGAKALELLSTNAADAVLLLGTAELDGALDPGRFHVLGVAAPEGSAAAYQPSLIGAAYLKGLSTGDLETVSTSLVLATLKGNSKSSKLKLFSSVYFAAQIETPRATELTAKVEGLNRHVAAQQALETLNTNTDNNVEQGDGQ